MSGYGDVKTRRVLSFLKWLVRNKGVEVTQGGNHQTKVTIIHNDKAYPLPTSHNNINKFIIKDFMEFLVRNGICTKEEFDSKI